MNRTVLSALLKKPNRASGIALLSCLWLPLLSPAAELPENGDFSRGMDKWRISSGQPLVKTEGTVRTAVLTSPAVIEQELDPSGLRDHRIILAADVRAEGMQPGKPARFRLKIQDQSGNDSFTELWKTAADTPWKTVMKTFLIKEDCRTVVFSIEVPSGTLKIRDIRLIGEQELSASGRQLGNNVTEYRCGNRRLLSVGKKIFAEDVSGRTADNRRTVLPGETKNGFVVFFPEEPAGVYPGRFPGRDERKEKLVVRAAPGEVRTCCFALTSLRDLNKVEISLKHAGREKICAVKEVRYVIQRIGYTGKTCRSVPKYPCETIPSAMPAGSSRVFQLTVNAGRLKAGKYRSELLATADGRTVRLPLELEILPFELEKVNPWMFFYYQSSEKAAARDFPVMRKIGATSVILAQAGGKLRRTGNGITMDFTRINRVVNCFLASGFSGPLVYNPFHDRLLTQLLDLGGYGGRYPVVRNYGEHIYHCTEKNFPEELRPVYQKLILEIYRNASERKWPDFYYFAVDEPGLALYGGGGNSAWRMDAALLEHAMIRKAVPGIRIFSTAYELRTIRKLQPNLTLSPIPAYNLGRQQFRTEYEKLRGRNGLADELWGIDWTAMYDEWNPARLSAGFVPGATGCTGMTVWTFYAPVKTADPYLDLRGPYKRCSLTFYDGDEIVLNLTGEAIRTGIYDWRYLLTLRKAISGLPREQRTVREKQLKEILSGVDADSDRQFRRSRNPEEIRNKIIEMILAIKFER